MAVAPNTVVALFVAMSFVTTNLALEGYINDAVCLPSFISTPLTTVKWPNISAYTSVQVNVSSKILCGSVANMEQSLSFSFQDGTCTLYGLRNGTATQNTYYHSRINLPPDNSLEEVARRKPTFSTLQYGSQFASLAVDGDLTDTTMYHSGLFVKPWWQVDLTEERVIFQVQIFPRQHTFYFKRFTSMEVRVGRVYKDDGNLTSYFLLCSYLKVYERAEGHILCSSHTGIVGRYVSIQKVTAEATYMQFNDVNVFVLKK